MYMQKSMLFSNSQSTPLCWSYPELAIPYARSLQRRRTWRATVRQHVRQGVHLSRQEPKTETPNRRVRPRLADNDHRIRFSVEENPHPFLKTIEKMLHLHEITSRPRGARWNVETCTEKDTWLRTESFQLMKYSRKVCLDSGLKRASKRWYFVAYATRCHFIEWQLPFL